MITEYKPFWDPFLKNEEFSLCRWKTKETTLAAAVPDLYETLGEETMWRAVVLYHGSAERGTNPFDFFSGEESAQEVEQNDLIRLTHMLSVVPRRVEVYPEPPQTGSAGRPGTFQAAAAEDAAGTSAIGAAQAAEGTLQAAAAEDAAGISAIGAAQAAEGAAQAAAGNGTDSPGTAAGSAPSGSAPARAEYTDKDYILDTELHFVSRREDKDYYTLGDSNYEILCARPGKILLVATRKKDLSEEALHRSGVPLNTEVSQIPCALPKAGFCDRNDYPANIRYMVYDAHMINGTAGPVMGEKDLFILMHAMMTLLMNESAVQLRAENVYRIRINVDEDALRKWVCSWEEKQHQIGLRVSAMQRYLEEDRQNSRDFGELPNLEENYYIDLSIDSNENYTVSDEAFRLMKDSPRPDEAAWRQEKSKTNNALRSLLKEPVRRLKYSLEKVREIVRREETPASGRFSVEQLEDAGMEMEKLEREMFQGDVITTARVNEKEKERLERDVQEQVETRMTKRVAFGGLFLSFLVFAAGMIPWLVGTYNSGDPVALSESLIFIAGGAGLLLAVWVIFLLISRWRLRRRIRGYNDSIGKVVDSYRALQREYQGYVTKAFNYRKYWAFIGTLHEEDNKFYVDDNARARVNLLRHKGAAGRAMDLCARLKKAMNIQDELSVYTGEPEQFTFGETPEESGYYVLPYKPRRPDNPWAEENIYYGYDFVDGFQVKREEWNV